MKLVISTKVLIYCALFGVVLVVSGVVLGFRIFPMVVSSKVWENSVLTEGTRQWNFFKKIPFPFQMKAYFFNVQNPEEILRGAKPKVKEIGPYVYNLYRWKDDIEWNSDDISYYDWTRLEFDKKASGGLSDEDSVTILNIPFNSLLLIVEEISPQALSAVDGALPLVFKEHNGLFLTAKVKDLMFEGLTICEGGAEEDFMAKSICTQFRGRAKEAKPMEVRGKSISYANLRYKNYTHLGRYTVNSGLKVREHLNDLVKFENLTYISTWNDGPESTCNVIRGTTQFRPYVTKDMKFTVFGEDICRHLDMEFLREETVKGIKGYKYRVPLDSFNASKDDTKGDCYCINKTRNANGDFGCMLDGLLEMRTCMGAPVVLSFPHLLHAHEDYKAMVDGLNPNEEIHDTFVILEPTSGAPLKMAKRVQFNMFVRPLQDIESIENVTGTLMPMFWMEESMTLPDEHIDMINNTLLINLKILEIIKWVLIGLGTVTVVVSNLLVIYKI